MNVANDLNLTLNLIFQGQEVSIPTLKVPTLSVETINFLGMNALENPIDLNSFSERIQELKGSLSTYQGGMGLKCLAAVILSSIAISIVTIAFAILGFTLPIPGLNLGFVALTMGCLSIMGSMFIFGPLQLDVEEKDASLEFGKTIDFFLENDYEEELREKILTEPENIDLQNALQELQKARKFYLKYAEMRAPNISPASVEILKQICIDLDHDHSGFDLAASVNSVWEKLSDSIHALIVYENYHTYYTIVHLTPLTLLVGAVALGIISLNPLTYIAGMIGLMIAVSGLLKGAILEAGVRANRLDVEHMTSRLKTFFSEDFRDEIEILADKNEEKALSELDKVITFYTNLPEPELTIEEGCTFSGFLVFCQRGGVRNGQYEPYFP